jgi:H+/Cl- antiporter ClcA
MTARRLTPWLIGVGVVTFLAGLLFGYDQGVISGAVPLLQDDLGIFLAYLADDALTSSDRGPFQFAILYAAAFVFVWRLVPETKGRSLEEIQADWKA